MDCTKGECFMLKNGMKIAVLALLILMLTVGHSMAEIIPPNGPGQIGYQAVVLCNSLSVRETMSTKAKAVKSLRAGDTFIVQTVSNGWADVFVSETGGSIGWVLADYIAVDPAWYKCETSTPVFAWGDTAAPKVALLDRGTKLPILKDMGDWLVVSLRGASGWIQKTATDKAGSAQSLAIGDLSRADLITPRGVYTLFETSGLKWIYQAFSSAEAVSPTGCAFDCTLILYQTNGQTLVVYPASDGCPYLRTAEGDYYAFGDRAAALRQFGSTASIAETFYAWFGVSVGNLYDSGNPNSL